MAYDTTIERTLFWTGAGPRIRYKRDAFGETLTVDDLNPENKISFRLSPAGLLRLGFKCIWAAVVP